MTGLFWDKPPIAIAHRGGAARYGANRHRHENTLAAFKEAVDLGYRYLEIDVVATRDSQVIILHVATDKLDGLRRQKDSPKPGQFEQLTYSEVKKQLGRNIPTLGQALGAFPHTKFLIDAKTDKVVAPLAEEIIRLKAFDRVFVNSFFFDRVTQLQQLLDNKVPSGLIIGRYMGLINRKLRLLKAGKYSNAGFSAIVLPYKFLDEEIVDLIHAQGLKVLVWTLNAPNQMQKAIDLGADGIMSDNIELLGQILKSKL